jgi:hypothetical protein
MRCEATGWTTHGSSAGDWLLTYWRMNLLIGLGQIQARLAVDHGSQGSAALVGG